VCGSASRGKSRPIPSPGDFDGLTGSDVQAIFIGQSQPGAFRLVIDDVALQ